MRKWLILLFALGATTASGAPAWTWVDANGQVHYSDRPVPGARQVDLAGAQAFAGQTPIRSAGRSSGGPAAPPPYQAIDVVSPAEQETLWNIGGTLNVQVRSQPTLQPGHRFDIAVDGERRNLNTTSGRVSVPNVFRGTHTLEVLVLDAAGMEIMRSPARTFYVQQTSIQNPNNPNRPGGANPPPRPSPAPRN
jgi:hypothetical protein